MVLSDTKIPIKALTQIKTQSVDGLLPDILILF
jgi:hypothetical protein